MTSRRPIWTSAACSRTDSAASSRTVSSARALASLPRWRDIGPTTWANSPTSRSAAVRNARRCRALEPEPGQLGDDLADGERVVVVVAAGLLA